jgi:ferredoxin
MRSITKSKDREEILESLNDFHKLYLIGCGTCATMCRTGGVAEVVEMSKFLTQKGKDIVGWTVIPTACDVLSHEIMKEEKVKLSQTEVILEMSCGFGNQQIARGTSLPVLPANDTVSMSIEFPEGTYTSACMQCGECLLGATASVCPMIICPKTMCNGPCGGTDNGMCEVDKNKDCAWTLIYNKLKDQGRLDELKKYHPPKNYQRALKPVPFLLDER